MQRRIALALSLVFTTIVTFSIVAVGAQAGFFSEHKTAKAAQVAPDTGAASDAAVVAIDAAPPPANQDPLVVTDYVYIDQTAVPVGVRGTRAPAPRPATPIPPALTAASKPREQSATSTQPDNGASSGDATDTPASPPTAAPTPTEPAAAPTAVAPSATATAPPQPSSTPKPAATSTTMPAQPTATAGTGQPGEIEFVGRVTAINGNMVTFAHGSTSTTVQVTTHLSALHMGTQAQVHAILSGGIYVATEIELGD